MSEVDIQAVRSSGPGGQHVNKTASAAHLFFDVAKSSLPPHYKTRLLALEEQRVTQEGVIVLKAQEHRSLEKNREVALVRLRNLIQAAVAVQKRRRPTGPTRTARSKRMDSKTKAGQIKSLRGRIRTD